MKTAPAMRRRGTSAMARFRASNRWVSLMAPPPSAPSPVRGDADPPPPPPRSSTSPLMRWISCSAARSVLGTPVADGPGSGDSSTTTTATSLIGSRFSWTSDGLISASASTSTASRRKQRAAGPAQGPRPAPPAGRSRSARPAPARAAARASATEIPESRSTGITGRAFPGLAGTWT